MSLSLQAEASREQSSTKPYLRTQVSAEQKHVVALHMGKVSCVPHGTVLCFLRIYLHILFAFKNMVNLQSDMLHHAGPRRLKRPFLLGIT